MSADGERSASEDARKIFVGGLPPSATKDTVRDYFSQYGEIEMCTIKTDVYTGRSRGFGFLIFKDLDALNQALEAPEGHEIDGKKIDAKLATPQVDRNGAVDPELSVKVFVGGLSKSSTIESIKAAFGQRGSVKDVYLPIDKEAGGHKGYCFVSFDDSGVASTLCAEGKLIVDGSECDIKKAKSKSESQSRGMMRGGGRGGRGGYNNGYGGGFDQYGGGYGGGYSGAYGGGFGGAGGYSGGGGGGGYQGGYGSGYGGGYDSYGGYENTSGYMGGGNYGGGGYNQGNYGGNYGGGQDQYKMKGGRGRGGGYQPY